MNLSPLRYTWIYSGAKKEREKNEARIQTIIFRKEEMKMHMSMTADAFTKQTDNQGGVATSYFDNGFIRQFSL